MRTKPSRNVLNSEPFILCKACGGMLHVSFFYQSKRTYGTYYDSCCKSCKHDKAIELRIINIEKYKAYQKEYHRNYKRKK
jgi:hypothetical protein